MKNSNCRQQGKRKGGEQKYENLLELLFDNQIRSSVLRAVLVPVLFSSPTTLSADLSAVESDIYSNHL